MIFVTDMKDNCHSNRIDLLQSVVLAGCKSSLDMIIFMYFLKYLSGGSMRFLPSRFSFFPLAAGVALMAFNLPACAASDYFLKFDGINGGSLQKGHEKSIEFTSFNWGVSIAPTRPGGSGGKPSFSDFFWTQNMDVSSTALFGALGTNIKTAVVDFTSLIGGQNQTYFRMSFDNVFLTDLTYSGSNGNPVGLAGSFAYDKVTLDYWAQDQTGRLIKSPSASYDLTTGQGSLAAVSALFAQGLAGPQVVAVPEPNSYAMFLAGLGILGAVARRRRATV